MKENEKRTRVLIVEDQFIEANNLRLVLHTAGYHVCTIARSVDEGMRIISSEKPK